MTLPSYTFDNQSILQPRALLHRQTLLNDPRPIKQVLVQWNGFAPEEATWDILDDLEDKIVPKGMIHFLLLKGLTRLKELSLMNKQGIYLKKASKYFNQTTDLNTLPNQRIKSKEQDQQPKSS